VEVNPARGTLDLWIDRDFPLDAFVRELARFGYGAGPRRHDAKGSGDDLVIRVGICVAIAMNTMIFAIARYAGVEDPATVRLFHLLELGLAAAAFLVGGTVFVRGAVQALRRGILHLDLPIALGIVLGYAGSIASLIVSGGRDSYLDTLVVFTTLMLVGRLLRQRVVEHNRARLLDDAGAEGLLVRRVVRSDDGAERVEVIPATTVRAGDVLLVAPGDVVPVAAQLLDPAATLSLEWITGEAEPMTASRGDLVLAGASISGRSAARFQAREDLGASALLDLLRAPAAGRDAPGRTERRVAAAWVPFVLVASALGFGGWMLTTGDVTRALAVTVGLLVVTCPCAFGIATPLGHEVVLAELRRRGLLVRAAGFLERAADVRTVVFDKTGTLTTGALRVRDVAPIAALGPRELSVLHDLAVRSGHPKSMAIAAAIPETSRRLDPRRVVHEVAGAGAETIADGRRWRLGSPSFAGAAADRDGDVVFAADGVVLARIATEEVLRNDAAAEIASLRAAGFEVWMLTGDGASRASASAVAAGIDADHVIAGQTPEGKAAWLRAHDRGDLLFLGDGINDAPAAAAATCSGTPAAGRTFLAARTDFYLLGEGLAGVRLALRGAAALRRRTRNNLRLSVLYNAIALALCFGGLMSPLGAAVLMPVSSLVAIGLTLRDLARKDSPWRC
jgi:Cu2+-exporting ATPase